MVVATITRQSKACSTCRERHRQRHTSKQGADLLMITITTTSRLDFRNVGGNSVTSWTKHMSVVSFHTWLYHDSMETNPRPLLLRGPVLSNAVVRVSFSWNRGTVSSLRQMVMETNWSLMIRVVTCAPIMRHLSNSSIKRCCCGLLYNSYHTNPIGSIRFRPI